MKRENLLEEFRKIRNQVNAKTDEPEKKARPEKKAHTYENFLKEVYPDIENLVDKLRPLDLLFFFMKTTEDCNVRFYPSQAKDCSALKKVQENYSNTEICVMIEFLFKSEQTYLDKDTVRPTLLSSTWQSTVFKDSQLWLNDMYKPKQKKQVAEREWKSDNKETKIGEWGE